MIRNVPEMVAERVALQLRGEGTVEIEPRLFNDQEDERLREFIERGCGCTLSKNGPCSTQFSLEHYRTVRANCTELSWGELNMPLTGQLMALTSDQENGGHPVERERSVTRYLQCGLRVCRNTFRFLHSVGPHRVKALKSHYLYLANGVAWQHWTCSPQCSIARGCVACCSSSTTQRKTASSYLGASPGTRRICSSSHAVPPGERCGWYISRQPTPPFASCGNTSSHR